VVFSCPGIKDTESKTTAQMLSARTNVIPLFRWLTSVFQKLCAVVHEN
jgi:hypothetical protein